MSTSPMAPLPPRGHKPQATAGTKKSVIWKRFIYVLLCIIILGIIWFIAKVSIALDDSLDEMSNPNVSNVADEEKADTVSRTILMLGVDYRKETGSFNTDVIMLLTMNPDSTGATLVSIPRDTFIDPEGWRGGKANSFYAKALSENDNDKYAAMKVVKQIFSDYMGVPIDYVSVVNFKAFEQIVDELGGVEVYVDRDLKYIDRADGTNIDLKEGLQELNGDQALDFVRHRKAAPGTQPSNDFERNERQQRLLSAVVSELKSFNAAVKLPEIINALGDNIRTDIPREQIKSFVYTYKGIDNENIKFMPLEGTWDSPYVYLDETKLAEAKAALQARYQIPDATVKDTVKDTTTDEGSTEQTE